MPEENSVLAMNPPSHFGTSLRVRNRQWEGGLPRPPWNGLKWNSALPFSFPSLRSLRSLRLIPIRDLVAKNVETVKRTCRNLITLVAASVRCETLTQNTHFESVTTPNLHA